ncbi:hypothetical protein [Amycolatopsis plumensis]|uniref:Secreted protein n=1 Tax=Amycolatopsis plumensis TaxID=236508 RepID=A0ABV5UAC0_9PSEU
MVSATSGLAMLACASIVPRVRRDDALPAERLDADELQGPEHHLDGDALGEVADQGGDERHGGVDVPVRADVGEYVHNGLRGRAPGCHASPGVPISVMHPFGGTHRRTLAH